MFLNRFIGNVHYNKSGNKSERLVSHFIVAGINIYSTMQPTLNERPVLIDIQLLHLTIASPCQIETINLGGYH